MGKIREILIGMKKTDDGDRQELEKLVFHTMNEPFDFISVPKFDFNHRVKLEIHKNPARFSRRFSLNAILNVISYDPELYDYSVVVSLAVSEFGTSYGSPDFRIEFRSKNRYERERVVCKIDKCSLKDPSDLELLIDQVFIFTGQENANPGLVYSRLLLGILAAHDQIRAEVHEATLRNINKEDGRRLFDVYLSTKRELVVQKKMLDDAERRSQATCDQVYVRLRNALDRVARLECAIQEAVAGLLESKSIIKSSTLEGIRSSLETALNDGKAADDQGPKPEF